MILCLRDIWAAFVIAINSVHFVPYRETLPEDSKTELLETTMVDTYLEPFFKRTKQFAQIGSPQHTLCWVPHSA